MIRQSFISRPRYRSVMKGFLRPVAVSGRSRFMTLSARPSSTDRTIDRRMTDQEQVDGLYAIQGFDHDVEEQLHDARIVDVRLFETEGEHITRTYEVRLDSGHVCVFKPGNGLLEAGDSGLFLGKQALARYDHTPISTTVSECAAWQLAKQLGEPWSAIVVPTVLKFAELPDTGKVEFGAAGLFRGGNVGKRGFYQYVPDQASAGAFFDALLGQQDRNKGNIIWYEARQVVYLIDHSFSFGKPGANRGASDLLEWRWGHGSQQLSQAELAALDKLLRSGDSLTLSRFVQPERVEALRARAERMLSSRRLVRDLG